MRLCDNGKGGFAIFLVILFALISCGPQKIGLFGRKKGAHEIYGDRIRDAGLDKTAIGSLWFFAADKTMAEPLKINLPHRETGYFAADKPAAAGYTFSARRGDRLIVTVSTTPARTPLFFVELWQYAPSIKDSKLLAEADSNMVISKDIEKDGQYLIRMQPELLQAVEYSIDISTGPSLAFPVDQSGNPKIISVWDDPRDGGVRNHEGVDIGAKFRTPVVASAEGFVNNVSVNRLGGNVVFMRPKGKDYTLYYAHLDTQTVSSGDEVKAGHVLGLVGNTGNARNTVPHLHFGIYAAGGAVDPLPFIDTRRAPIKEVRASLDNLNKWMRCSRKAKVYPSAYAGDSVLFEIQDGAAIKINAATGDWYKIELPDSREGFLKSDLVTDKPWKVITIDSTARLLDHPSYLAAAKLTVDEKSKMDVIGKSGAFFLVKYGENTGWIPQ